MTEAQTGEFLARLWELQAAAGLRNAELARRLDCHPSYISHLRAGREGRGRTIGLKLVLAATREFPQLRAFLLLAAFPGGNDNVPPGNDADANSEDRQR